MNIKYVVYRRVSTTAQGISGLGLDAQTESCDRFIKTNGGIVIKEFIEIESGKRTDKGRPELAKAIALCKQGGYTLLVAKLCRLARNLHFITTLQRSGVPFCAVDNPHATPLLIHILCAINEAEAVEIASRTRQALQQAKLRGIVLGNPRLHEARANAQLAVQNKKIAFAESAIKAIRDVQSASVTSYTKIAECLTKRGEPTSRGKQSWTATGVRRIIETINTSHYLA